MRLLIRSVLLALLATMGHAQCGPDAACTIEGGDYHLVLPQDLSTPRPALIWYHGHNSSAASIFRARGLRDSFLAKGYILIAPNGLQLPGRKTRAWPARPQAQARRDDVAFTLAVLKDAERRAPIDPARIYVAGFSAGGSMAWMMACYAPDKFAGFVSVSGALRRPNPQDTCPGGPFRLLQIHGFADKQVPFEGRGIRDWHQGDLFDSFDLARQTNACRSNPDAIEIGETFRCHDWSASCGEGALRMCIHNGGHGLPRGWTEKAKAFFEN